MVIDIGSVVFPGLSQVLSDKEIRQCTTPSVFGAIATLDPRRGVHPPKLIVYENLRNKYNPYQQAYGGVSIVLLDYLVVTALLLVTDLQEWALVPRPGYSEFCCSDQVEFDSARNLQMSNEEPLYPRRGAHLESSSMPSTNSSGPSSQPSYSVQPSYSSQDSQTPHTFIETDWDTEYEHESPIVLRRRSLSPVSEAFSEFESSHSLHEPTSPTGAVLSGQSPANSNSHRSCRLSRSASDGFLNSSSKSTQPLAQRRVSIRDSFVTAEDDVATRPNLPAIQRELLENSSTKTSAAINVRNRRPLPLLPTASGPDASSSESNREPSSPRPPRVLPPIPRQLPVAPSLHKTPINDIYPSLLDDSFSQALCATNVIYGRPGPITKASREDITQWLNSLTGDSSKTENTPASLLRASIFDRPPPAYDSHDFPSERHEMLLVSPSNTLGR